MAMHRAECACGRLQVVCEGAPRRISMCHCLDCQRRTGAMFGNQAWFSRSQILAVSGASAQFARKSEIGRSVTFQFCPFCGSTVYWEAEGFPGMVAVAVGAFADPSFPAPEHSIWERRRHNWAAPLCDLAIQHSNLDNTEKAEP